MRLPHFIAILSLALLTTLGLSAQSVRVIFVSGHASLQRPDEPALRAIVKGETVIIGTRIVTGADGRVVLTPMPGVKSIITPNTTILLESVSESQTSSTVVTHHAIIDLKEGAVVSDLHKPEGVAYDYSIRTARGLAGARGTTYTVGINAAGIQTVVVAHGSIFLNFTDGRQVTLAIGHLSITGAGGETKSVSNISELSPADQKIAQAWTETTVAAIASAIESGIELDPKALQNALDAAKSLGITLPPDLQAQVDRVLEKLTNPDKAKDGTDAKTASEVITQKAKDDTLTGFASFADFFASLNETQQAAFSQIIDQGFPDAPQFESLLRDGTFAANLVKVIDLYAGLDSCQRDTLVTLGILGANNLTAVGSDTDGLLNLVTAYTSIDSNAPELLYETDFSKTRENTNPIYGSNFFFPGTGANNGTTIYNVTFDTDGGSQLRVGATRNLIIDNTGYEGTAFNAGYSYTEGDYSYKYGSVELRASDLVSLNNTRFGPNVTNILIEAATLNLANISFPDGSSVQLNSKLAQANFGSSKVGYVNFIKNVNYGTNQETQIRIIDQNALNSATNIHVGHLGDSQRIY